MPTQKTAPKEGIFDVSFESYLDIDAVNNSTLKWGNKSAAHMRAAADGLMDNDTEPKKFGRKVHTAVFEPQAFARIPMSPFKDFKTDAAKLWKQANPTYLTEKDLAKIKAIAAAIRAHPGAAKLLAQDGKGERSLVCRDRDTGLWLKARVDFLAPVVVDGKSTRDASPGAQGFPKQAAYLGMHMQEAFYRRVLSNLGIPCDGFIFLAMETTVPYAVTLIELDGKSVTKGEGEVERLLGMYRDCLEKNSWPAYSEKVERVSIPDWALRAEPFESAESYNLETV